MSYNIDRIILKKAEGFELNIPDIELRMAAHFGRVDKTILDVRETTLEFISNLEIKGALKTDEGRWFEVEKMVNFVGEWSGTVWNEILLPSFAESKGSLEAVLIWEGGDSIERVFVEDGVFSGENVDL